MPFDLPDTLVVDNYRASSDYAHSVNKVSAVSQ